MRRPNRFHRLRLGMVMTFVFASVACCATALAEQPSPRVATMPGGPRIPPSDGEVLQVVPARKDTRVQTMETLRTRLSADPENLRVAVDLARAYIAFGRDIGDARYAGYAEAVIAPWYRHPNPSAAVLVLQATIFSYRHQFSEARTELHRALAADARNAQAWLSLATLDMVQGNYEAAAAECKDVARYGGYFLGLACTGNLGSYIGKAAASMVLLTQISGDALGLTPELKAWVQGLLAECAERLGEWAKAEQHYRNALAYTPDDNFLLVAYADFLLDRGRPGEVVKLLTPYAQSDTAFLRLALAHAALKSADTPRYVFLMAGRFEALRQRGSDYYGREQVRFALHLLHDPQQALDLALANWTKQRAPWDVRVLLEAAQAGDKPEAARTVLAFVRDTKLQDPIIEPLARRLSERLASAPLGATR